ncbi:hypothetical protein RRG08_008301 [Elysia crispata]|uniref:Uncharacterized protein n=1 Tax=Elysia crispata TaxID=231223 RepID=A0AAE1DJV6_9GAST|nr:hypothetical protein RRG08_008301 [Elysia crispata]
MVSTPCGHRGTLDCLIHRSLHLETWKSARRVPPSVVLVSKNDCVEHSNHGHRKALEVVVYSARGVHSECCGLTLADCDHKRSVTLPPLVSLERDLASVLRYQGVSSTPSATKTTCPPCLYRLTRDFIEAACQEDPQTPLLVCVCYDIPRTGQLDKGKAGGSQLRGFPIITPGDGIGNWG